MNQHHIRHLPVIDDHSRAVAGYFLSGIHFQSLRYISTTLAAYVGETVTLRIDPRDMAEIRVFHDDKFLCRAVCAELARETISLRDILRARNRRRRELRGVLRDRQTAAEHAA